MCDGALTMEKLKEALAIIEALTPKSAPPEMLLLRGATGLNIIKNDSMPEDTIVVSKRLFDMLFECSNPPEKKEC